MCAARAMGTGSLAQKVPQGQVPWHSRNDKPAEASQNQDSFHA